MSVGFFSANTTIKIRARIDQQRGTNGALYSGPPSNGYAIVTVAATGSVSSLVLGIGTGSNSTSYTFVSASSAPLQLYLGPGQSLSYSSGSGTLTAFGVEFENTPS